MGTTATPAPPPPTPPPPGPGGGFFAAWRPHHYLWLLTLAWSIVVALIGALWANVNGNISDLRTQVGSLNTAFNQTNAAGNSIKDYMARTTDVEKSLRETHDTVIGTVVPTLNTHTKQLADIQTSLGGVVGAIGHLQGSITQVQNSVNDLLREASAAGFFAPRERNQQPTRNRGGG